MEALHGALDTAAIWIGGGIALLSLLGIFATGDPALATPFAIGLVVFGFGASGWTGAGIATALAVGKELIDEPEDPRRAFRIRLLAYVGCAALSPPSLILWILGALLVDYFTIGKRASGAITAGFGVLAFVALLIATWNTDVEFLAGWGLLGMLVLFALQLFTLLDDQESGGGDE